MRKFFLYPSIFLLESIIFLSCDARGRQIILQEGPPINSQTAPTVSPEDPSVNSQMIPIISQEDPSVNNQIIPQGNPSINSQIISVTPQGDPFINRVRELNDIELIPEQFAEGLGGYKVPYFLPPQTNRNHFDDRPEGPLTPIKSLVMHYTVSNFQRTLDTFTKDIPANRVSATYVISETDEALGIPGGRIIQVTPEDKRAWHAGVSSWRELTNLNGTSVGIENVNKGFIDSSGEPRRWFPFDPNQIHALGLLSQGIIQKHHIYPAYVVGHADIAPGRKQDPGILFPWGQLYKDYAVGAWLVEEELNPYIINNRYCPQEELPQGVSFAFLSTYLKKYGYSIEPTAYPSAPFSDVLKAFKSHFSQNQNPQGYDGAPDENDMLWAWGLAVKYKSQ
jgi:N-acetylmuramoyl-L-alanine amidase